MKTIINLIAVAVLGLLLVGCVNNGNFARKNMSLPYDKGNAVTTKVTKEIEPNGSVTTKIEETTQTPMAVNKDITIRQLDDSRDAVVAQSTGRGFFRNLASGMVNGINTSGSVNVDTSSGGGVVQAYNCH